MFGSAIKSSGVAAMRGVSSILKASSNTAGGALAVSAHRGMMNITFGDKERGEEAVYMRKEDHKLLEALLKKEKAKAAGGKTTEREDLLALLGNHKLPDDVIDSLIHWKHH